MANDNWRTPTEVFQYFNKEYNFKYDVCASDNNHLCGKYLTENDDFLAGGIGGLIKCGEFAWCNPPYSNPLPFVQQCIYDSNICGIGYVMLLNHDMSTKWATMLCNIECKHIVFTGKRIAFLNADGLAIKGNNKGQFVAIIPPFVRNGFAKVEYIPLNCVMRKGSTELLKEQDQLI